MNTLNARGVLAIGDQEIGVSYDLKLGRTTFRGPRELTGTIRAPKIERRLMALSANRGELTLEGGMRVDVIVTSRSLERANVVVIDKPA